MSSIFVIDDITTAVIAEFTAKSIVAQILIGEWETFRNDSGARVIFGLGDGSFEPVMSNGDHYATGPNFPLTATTEARPLWRCIQSVKIWVVFPQDDAVAPDLQSLASRRGCQNLLHQTMRALWHAHGGYFPCQKLVWINEAQADSIYGSACSFEALFSVPVLDDDLVKGDATDYTFGLSVEFPTGEVADQGTSTGP